MYEFPPFPIAHLLATGHLTATVLHTLFDVGTLRVTRSAPANLVKLAEDTKPIAELF